ncbi:MAG TPA: peptidylprolyl isomerase [Actinomycetota bacterium]|nr:peptidylprolyl isomerase [Actinomycetota bacterium]
MPDARKRQLQKLAARRAAERQRQRRQRIIAGVVAGAVALGGIGLAATAFLGDGEQPQQRVRETPQPGPTATSAGDVACGGKVPKAEGEEKPTFQKPPEMQIDPKKNYRATMQTSCGTIELELFADQTPITVNNFVFLAREGFFDGLTFHRVIPGFVLQGGDPEGTGAGGPGYQFEDEIVKELTFDEPGLLAMANSGPGTNGSQFFITTGPAEHLDGLHTIFGRVTDGMDAVEKIDALGTQSGTPSQTIYIEKVTIEES